MAAVLVGEVAPLAPLLIPLSEVLVWAVAFALCLLCVYLAKAFFGAANSAVGWIPYLGKVATRSLTSIEQKIVSFMSQAAASTDAKMGAALHELARVVDWLGAEIRRHANLLVVIAGLLAGQPGIALIEQGLANLLRHSKVAQATANHALKTAIALPRTVARGIGEDVLPRIKSLEREAGHIIGIDIPGIRAGEARLYRGIDDLRKWVTRHALEAGTLATTAAVAWALARLGSSWIRCSNWNRIGKTVCGLPGNWIEDLLGLVADFLILENICQVIPWLEEGLSVVALPLVEVMTAAGAGLCAAESSPPEVLPSPGLQLPPNPSIALYLPG